MKGKRMISYKTVVGAFCATLLTFSTANAQDPLKLHIASQPNSIMFRLSVIVAEELNQRGWNVDLKSLSNCALTKSTYETTNEPIMTFIGNEWHILPSDPCYMEVTPLKEIVSVPLTAPYFMCVRKDSNLTADDILSGKKDLSFAITPDPLLKMVFDSLKTSVKTDRYKPIVYKNSGFAVNAFIAEEIDVYIGTAGKEVMKNHNAKCFFNTGLTDLENTKSLAKVLKTNINLQLIPYYIAKNLSEEKMNKLRNDMKEITSSEKWIKTSFRYHNLQFTNLEEARNFILEAIKNNKN